MPIIYVFQADQDISQLARQNEVLKEYIHINELLLDIALERKRVVNVITNTHLPNFMQEFDNRNRDLVQALQERKAQVKEIIAGFL